MKIAIIGNMNNNGFALMRYFRDLGADAHLLLYSNDGVDSLAHFAPDNDSFNYHKWNNYIHQTDIHNGPHQTLPDLLQWTMVKLFNLRSRLLSRSYRLTYLSANTTKRLFSGYDFIVTSGYGLAVLKKAGVTSNIFSPYSSGIEGVCRRYAPSASNLFSRGLFEWGRYRQIISLKQSGRVVTAEMGITNDLLADLHLGFKPLAMPMVYVEQDCPVATGEDHIDQVGRDLIDCDFSVLMHSRLAWNADVCRENHVRSKNNQWVIKSFKAVIEEKAGLKAKLVILEYGPDAKNTKKLVTELGLDSHVIWLPKTSRKNLMWLLGKVTVGVGEFIESPRTIWGGTGWEVLASAKPLLQGFYFEEGKFEELYGYPEPPLLKVRSQEDVTEHLLEMAGNPEKAKLIGQESHDWFNRHNGYNLAKQWLSLLAAPGSEAHRGAYQAMKPTGDV